MPGLKQIIKPEYNKTIKHNGTTIKNILPLRIKFPTIKNKKNNIKTKKIIQLHVINTKKKIF